MVQASSALLITIIALGATFSLAAPANRADLEARGEDLIERQFSGIKTGGSGRTGGGKTKMGVKGSKGTTGGKTRMGKGTTGGGGKQGRVGQGKGGRKREVEGDLEVREWDDELAEREFDDEVYQRDYIWDELKRKY